MSYGDIGQERVNNMQHFMLHPSQCSTPPNAVGVGGNSEEDTGSSLRKIQVVLKIRELGFLFVLQLYNRLLKFLAKGWLNNMLIARPPRQDW